MNRLRSFLLAIVGAAFLATVAQAEDPELMTDKERIKLLEQQVARMQKQVEMTLQLQKLLQQMQELTARITKIEQRLEQKSQSVTSNFPSSEVGTLILDNRRGAYANFIVEGISYRVAPYSKQEVPSFRAGSFRYQIDTDDYGTARPLTSTRLANKEKLTLYVE